MNEFEVLEKELEQETEETKETEETTMQDIGIDARIMRAISEMGFTKMTPIQEQAIPYLLDGKDIIGQAQTGTGKTAAFGIPLIQTVDVGLKSLQAIVLCPTRELAMQAAEEIRKLAKYMPGMKILPVYGGQDISKQIRGLKGVQIVVGTPGRVMDHMRRRTLKMDDINMVVLDEADEMLNMGFREDMETILGQIPGVHRTALFSATMPKAILEITKKFQKPEAVHVKVAAKELTIPLVKQSYYKVAGRDKMDACARLLEYYQPKLSLIFCNTKRMVDDLTENLKKRGYQAEGLHGDLSQNQRDTVMNRFRNGAATILIATDVAARGIDVDDVEAVINYDIPQDIEYYVHRIGRTGRAGRKGRAFTLISGKESYKIREIERVCKTKIEERKLPDASEVTKARAKKILNEVMEIRENSDLSKMERLIERKIEKEECSALEIAAAFLKLYMGEEIKEIPEEKYVPRKKYNDRPSGGRNGRKPEYGRGGRDNREGGNRGGGNRSKDYGKSKDKSKSREKDKYYR